jgi:hypothetical protein
MRFEATYRCYSVAMMNKEHLENGGKSAHLPLVMFLALQPLLICNPCALQSSCRHLHSIRSVRCGAPTLIRKKI